MLGDQDSPGDFMAFVLFSFPPLRDAGGFELMRIMGTTRSRQLTLIPCPNEGYIVSHLRDPGIFVNQATLYIRPIQRDLNLTNVTLLITWMSVLGNATLYFFIPTCPNFWYTVNAY